jgi:EmrB/QacA subfamily drug resistance transporter
MSVRAQRDRISQLGVLILLAVAEFTLTLDVSIVNVALPAIRGDLGLSDSSLQWVVNGYGLTFGGFLLLGGRVADVFGGRAVFLRALSAFSLASLGCALSTGPVELIAARVVQGLSAGVLSPATLSILTSTYRQSDERNQALSIWTAVAFGGGAVGALLGGLLTGALSWRWIFLVNVPVGACVVALAARCLPRVAPDGTRARLDIGGAVSVTAGLTALVWALTRTGAAGWASIEVIGPFAAAALLLGVFVVAETRLTRSPLVPFAVFRSRPLWAGNLLSFLSFLPVLATWFFLTLYVQQVRGYTPIGAGLVFLPLSLALVGGSQASFRLMGRVEARILFATGGLLAAVGMAWLGRFSGSTEMVWVILPASITMAGGGLMSAPITVAATSGVGPEQGGLASGLLNTTRQLGGSLGLAVLGTIAAAHTGQPGTGQAGAAQAMQTAGYAAALTVGAATFVLTALVGAFALPARPATSPPDRPDSGGGSGALRDAADIRQREKERSEPQSASVFPSQRPVPNIRPRGGGTASRAARARRGPAPNRARR